MENSKGWVELMNRIDEERDEEIKRAKRDCQRSVDDAIVLLQKIRNRNLGVEASRVVDKLVEELEFQKVIEQDAAKEAVEQRYFEFKRLLCSCGSAPDGAVDEVDAKHREQSSLDPDPKYESKAVKGCVGDKDCDAENDADDDDLGDILDDDQAFDEMIANPDGKEEGPEVKPEGKLIPMKRALAENRAKVEASERRSQGRPLKVLSDEEKKSALKAAEAGGNFRAISKSCFGDKATPASKKALDRFLSEMVEEGVMTREGEGLHTTWRITAAAAEVM